MEKIRDLKVKVVAFPVDEYTRPELSEKSAEELLKIAGENPNCTIWNDLEYFQICINDDCVDVDNNWIIFINYE
jgi:hypothetical protein